MQKFTSLRLPNLAGNTGLVKLGLVILAGLIINVGRAAAPVNDNFANASPLIINNLWGSTNGDNSLATSESGSGEPSHAGFAPSHSVWYQWVAPQDGEVEFDTLGSLTVATNVTRDLITFQYVTNIVTVNLDTVLAVYTGTSLSALSQVAANDDLYPYEQENYTAQNIYYIADPIVDPTIPPVSIQPVYGDYYQPYGGP